MTRMVEVPQPTTSPVQAIACGGARPGGLAPGPSEVVTLEDGRTVTIRPVRPQDAEPINRLFEQGLSPTSRRRRFHIGIMSLPPAILVAMTRVDQVGHVAIVAESGNLDDDPLDAPVIVAEARYVIEAPGDQAEIALAVADLWQGQGLGAALLGRLCRQARLQRLRGLRADVMANNAPMLALLRKRGSRESRHPDDGALRRLWLPVDDGLVVTGS